MNEYRIVCNDTYRQCGDIYDELGGLLEDFDALTWGHDEQHDHLILFREVTDWTPYTSPSPREVAR